MDRRMDTVGQSLKQTIVHDEPAFGSGSASSSLVIRLDPPIIFHQSWLHLRRTYHPNLVLHPRLRHPMLLLRPQRPEIPPAPFRPGGQHNLLRSGELPASQRKLVGLYQIRGQYMDDAAV